MPLLCFATVNFYDEIDSPQNRGMLKFFDASFISRPAVKSGLVRSLSELPDFIKNVFANEVRTRS